MISRADAYQQQRRWVGLPLAVLYKFVDDQGSYLAAQITYYGVVSLFPLLLLLTTFLGYGLHDSRHFQRQVLDSALAQFPVVGDQIARNIYSFHGSVPGLVIGIVGCVYGGLGIVQATQNALNKVWGVPRNARHNPIKARLRSLLLLAVGGASVIVTTVLTALGAAANDYGASAGVTVRVLATSLAVALNVALFMVAFRVLTARQVTFKEIRAGAIAAAVTWQALQVGGALLLGQKLKGATATYGLFAIVLGLLAWVYVGSATVVMCAEFNVVRAMRMWPRSLLSPFSDGVEITVGDERAYTSYAKTELHKSFETIDVRFGEPGRRAATSPAVTAPESASCDPVTVQLNLVALVVDDYDPAIDFFVRVLGFDLAEDSPSMTNDGRPKRWVVVRPPGAETGLLLARADGENQAAAIGKQAAGRVGFFLRVDDFDESYGRLTAADVTFVRPPRQEPYGTVAVFLDIAGNKWDLVGPSPVG
jgi:YihY family inner membrane protein